MEPDFIDAKATPAARPWLFALGASLALGAVVLWYLRKPCDCEHGEGEEKPASRLQVARWMEQARSSVTSSSGLTEPVDDPADPLAWDTHARDAWGLNVGGPRTLDAWAAASDGSDEPEEQEQYHQN